MVLPQLQGLQGGKARGAAQFAHGAQYIGQAQEAMGQGAEQVAQGAARLTVGHLLVGGAADVHEVTHAHPTAPGPLAEQPGEQQAVIAHVPQGHCLGPGRGTQSAQVVQGHDAVSGLGVFGEADHEQHQVALQGLVQFLVYLTGGLLHEALPLGGGGGLHDEFGHVILPLR